MCLLFRRVVLMLVAMSAGGETLRVCADPNNLPYSNERREGFENRIAELIARDLGMELEFVWWLGRQQLVRNTLNSGRCDVLVGVPSTLEPVTVTKAYYRSTYVFVSKAERRLGLVDLNDRRLAEWRIGLHLVGGAYAPPAYLLARRGETANLVGYSLYGAYGEADPAAKPIQAVGRGEVDVAIVWGPVGGYYAGRGGTGLAVAPVHPESFEAMPFTYDISMAVRRGNTALRDRLDEALRRQCRAVRQILDEYRVPRLGEASCESVQSSSVWLH